MTIPTPDALYFGCDREIGHYLFLPGMRSVWGPLFGVPTAIVGRYGPDGVFPPNAGQRQRVEVEGEAALHHVEGWTVLAFWDRSVDRRGNSNSAFLLCGELAFEAAVARAREAFHEVWARFKFEVRLAVSPSR